MMHEGKVESVDDVDVKDASKLERGKFGVKGGEQLGGLLVWQCGRDGEEGKIEGIRQNYGSV
ncbi:unnamed protein product [Clonostachys rosea]|uniref:Uncharacterized protein n=1 Tax=Bionectria ochroleuca TaxID=29856 RepID=A0ABY6UVV0_BIOOC|nr:unnamed protein product [Clonostachys rosea]